MTAIPLPLAQRRAFLDSAGFLAVLNPRDEHHQQARAIWDQLIRQRFRLYTSNFVIAETHNLFLVRVGHRQATTFLRNITQSSVAVIRVQASDEQRARDIVLHYTDKDFSLTDATSFTVMARLGITDVLTFDQHFTQYGLNVLTP